MKAQSVFLFGKTSEQPVRIQHERGKQVQKGQQNRAKPNKMPRGAA